MGPISQRRPGRGGHARRLQPVARLAVAGRGGPWPACPGEAAARDESATAGPYCREGAVREGAEKDETSPVIYFWVEWQEEGPKEWINVQGGARLASMVAGRWQG